MKEIFDKVIAFIKSNILITALVGLVLVFLLFGKSIKKLFGGTRRVRHRRVTRVVRRVHRRRRLPRSVGIRKRRNKPSLPRNKNGTRKKPWQVKGSIAARRHMAQIRARR